MKVSTRGRYGLRALVDMTIHSNNAPVSLVQVANQREDFSELSGTGFRNIEKSRHCGQCKRSRRRI